MPDNTTIVSVGDYVTDVSFLPFIREQAVKFQANGLKPNSKLYAFFDRVAVSAYCQPGTLDANNSFSATGALGAQLTANTTGGCSGTFFVPAATFFVGEREFVLMDVSSVNSTPTTSTSMMFNAYNYSVSKSPVITTRPPSTPQPNTATQPPVTTPPAPPVVTPPAPVVISNNSVTPAAITWANLTSNVVWSASNTQTWALQLTTNSSVITGITQPIQLAFVVNTTSANVYNDSGQMSFRQFTFTARPWANTTVPSREPAGGRVYNICSTLPVSGPYAGTLLGAISVGTTPDQLVYDYSGTPSDRTSSGVRSPIVIPGDGTGYTSWLSKRTGILATAAANPAAYPKGTYVAGGFQNRNIFHTFGAWSNTDYRQVDFASVLAPLEPVTVANGEHIQLKLQTQMASPILYSRLYANGNSLNSNGHPADGNWGNTTSRALFTVDVLNLSDSNTNVGTFTVNVRILANNFTGSL